MTLRAWWLSVAVLCAIVAVAAAELVAIAGRDDAGAAPSAGTWLPLAVRRVVPVVGPTKPAPVRTVRITMGSNSVAIPVQHVRAPIVSYCPIIDGGLEPPADVHEVCYWAGGAAIGDDVGTTVLTGHINWAGVTGAFGNLASLHRDDLVLTVGTGGAFAQWRVARVEHRPKTLGIDPRAFVGHAGPRRLYLISCGGAFDTAAASYVDNIYVRAVPVPPIPPTPPPPQPRPVE
ncbi:MAG: hypothetical protein QOH89_2509 [Pseudonocardiales bacterium]|jgi:hypothetical protein|nr:hypothetical protein [Pseudonocardiales bacterium]MDT4941226.1 hypothetical protein [Pseudonocardiales bacterium]